MVRPNAVASGQYFPTPARVVEAVCRHLEHAHGGADAPARSARSGRRVIRLLDPCAGRGDAAAAVAAALGAESFGIELNTERAEACRARLDHTLASSAFSVRLANGAFSCLWLNPPYDYDDEKRRLEHAFLTTLSRALAPGGLLVFLIPQRRLAVSARYLASHYGRFAAYRFPDPEFGSFGQMVLFAVKKGQASADPAAQAALERWSTEPLPALPLDPSEVPDGAPLGVLRVPALPSGDVLFSSLFFDAEQAAAEARRRGAWAQPQLAEQLWPKEEQPVRPLMPLRRGHLALLIAAGLLNNVALEQDGRRVLVKGRTRKTFVPVERDDQDVRVEREVIRTSVVALDLGSGALELIEQGGAESSDGGHEPTAGGEGKEQGAGGAPGAPDRASTTPAAYPRLPKLPRGPSLGEFL
jgi:SAM-dependent methyltransferase